MTVRTRAVLNSNAVTDLANNTSGAITPTLLRKAVQDQADSAFLVEDLSGATDKATPVDADWMWIWDSVGTVASKVTFANLKAFLKTWLDSLTTTFTNKRITPRIGTEASSATSTPTADTVDQWNVTALAAADAFAAPTGTPTEGQKLIIRITDNGTARALTWDGIYRSCGGTLPTTTVISKTLYIGLIYNGANTKWDCVAVALEP